MSGVVPGTPRWAVVAAWATVLAVLPSAVWRTAVGLGIPLGWSAEQLQRQQIPGWGTVYVLALSAGSLLAASLTLGLVRGWGERVPDRIPVVGGRRVPAAVAVVAATAGAVTVLVVCASGVRHWDRVSGFADRPGSVGALLMVACYLPALLWGPLLLAVTGAYWRRRLRTDEPNSVDATG